ncbi:MAG TPA: hypothetical protein VFQ50_10220 [Flavobacterium sp.]|nr:hypothetical protein [Flavobacterium sp.]
MKKLLLLGIAAAIFSCNSDDEDREECTNRVWGMVENCNEDETECSYVATFGETQGGSGSIITNLATYEYYTGRGNTTDGSVCWEGTKD